ncbi:MAG: tetratricopeptide repeat protein [Gemmatimonadetes bacterium]|nr:tetratricopeptide repeat protein [Gemmatimonadota bacterium]
MAAPLTSERDRATLLSFARRIDPSDAGAHNNLGVLYYNKGLYEEAVAAFTKALELDPKMQVAQRNLEVAYFSTGFYDSRVALLRDRLRLRVDDREARWELGRAYALLGHTEEAIAEFTALLRHHPGDIAAIVQLGLAEKANGSLGDAQRWFEEALKADPSSSVTHFYLGEVLYNQGRAEEALHALLRAVELNPENPDAHFLLGFVYGELGRHEEARAESARAVQLNPTLSRAQANLSIDQYSEHKYAALLPGHQERRANRMMQVAEGEGLAHYTLGLAYRQKGYLAEAEREYRLALDRGEDRGLVQQAMAELCLLRKDPVAAIALYDELVSAQPESPKLWNERGVALHQSGKYSEAAESYRLSLAADGRYALAHNNLAIALYHEGRRDDAIDAFRAALDANPGFTKARLNLALLLTKTRRYQLALEAYRQVLAGEPEQPTAWNGVGLVLSELRKFEDARNAFARAIEARPDFAEAHYNLSFTLSGLGDFDGALRETKRALELDPYYVAQKFSLAIDLEYEDTDLSIVPDLGGEQRMSTEVDTFAFDPQLLDTLFTELSPTAEPATPAPAETDAYAMAADYLTKGLFDRARAETSRALSRGAPPAEGNALLGDVLCRQGAYGDALERYLAARSADPRHVRALRGEAQALLMLGRGPEASEAADRLLAVAPNDVDAMLLAASCRFEAGDPAAALEILEQARRAAPARADVLRWIGNIARSMGDLEGAIASYRHALELDADFAAVRFDLARLLVERRDWDEAERHLLAALDSVPTYTEATLELSALRRMTGRHRDALALLVELLQRDPYSFDGLIALGETLSELGRRADAATAFRRVLTFDPDHVGALFHEGVLLAEQKRYREAIARWEQVADLEPAGEYARRARREARTAGDLLTVFGERARGG